MLGPRLLRIEDGTSGADAWRPMFLLLDPEGQERRVAPQELAALRWLHRLPPVDRALVDARVRQWRRAVCAGAGGSRPRRAEARATA